MASINGIQVKEYIQSLTDEGKLRVEKIGSGNWYWSFASDEIKERESQLGLLKREMKKLQESYEEIQGRLTELKEKRQMEEGNEHHGERDGLVRTRAGLEREVASLRARLADAENGRGKGVQRMKAEMGELKAQAHQWTDDVYILEGYLRELAGGDHEVVQAIQREFYGEEFAEAEAGLRELGDD